MFFRAVLLSLLLLFSFVSDALAENTCDYAIDVITASLPEAVTSTYDTAAEAQSVCAADKGSSCSAGFSSVYYRPPPDYTWTFYVYCDSCSDSCPMDNVCDTCEQIAECACQNDGGVLYTNGSPPNCSYECKGAGPCEDQNPTPSEACGSDTNVEWIDTEKCLWKCECDNYNDYQVSDCSDPEGYKGFDYDTCQWIPCDSPCSVVDMASGCPLGFVSKDYETCEKRCVTCADEQINCDQGCPHGGNLVNCSEAESGGTIGTCVCNDDPQAAEPDPDDNPDNPPGDPDEPFPGDPNTGASPDPDSPNDPDAGKTCSDYQADCAPSCQWACYTDSSGAAHPSCDCRPDPAGDDGANGWLEAIEDNTNRAADSSEKQEEWAKAQKRNSDEQLEDSDNIAENTRRGVNNNRGYFAGSDGSSVFKDDSGTSYLETIANNTDPDNGEDIETSGSGTAPEGNSYDSSVDGLPPVEDTFSEDLANYIATGIPLVSWIENSSISLSSASSSLDFSFWGHPISVNFAEYVSVIDLVGNLLFYLTIFSSFMMIVTRIKY